MTKIKILIVVLFLNSCALFSQADKKLEFHIVKPQVSINIEPAYSYLFQHISHPIKIEVEDSLHTYIYKLAGGSISETDSGMFIIPETRGEVILNVFEVKAGNEILVFSKNYLVLPEPKAYLRRKPTDNVLEDMLLVSGVLKGVTTYNRKKYTLPVKSFTVVYKDGENRFKSVAIVGNKIPVPTRKEITKLPNGSMIYFESIIIELMPRFEAQIQPYRVTMNITESKDITSY